MYILLIVLDIERQLIQSHPHKFQAARLTKAEQWTTFNEMQLFLEMWFHLIQLFTCMVDQHKYTKVMDLSKNSNLDDNSYEFVWNDGVWKYGSAGWNSQISAQGILVKFWEEVIPPTHDWHTLSYTMAGVYKMLAKCWHSFEMISDSGFYSRRTFSLFGSWRLLTS